ncbi:hypothetical protein [Tetragenococcus koreensis]|uniref:Uncharacterized protein n=1 Tax=Tetragenococcus koreensis TaxID=290335 RepID=A0AAN4ZSD7_9ENTE|nr:hypothetical protein [Tetragenococcus koreensis]MCF1633005.1 hypothetical protein [Tetragenococcus koreensis]GEQ49567.1 hypothetical protein TK11N_14190 [Tetragenococcus koreensis]GEQ52013.1 hypothetical protein TK12N_13570 [Tetragenococcus koreensis]GEQ54548.1 hypothetical protein TK2N_13920 [Tetragenococcus koreensis]GEQ57015.1 hypothetical protein TK4N_13580 [Tetragenococcus koreensis]
MLGRRRAARNWAQASKKLRTGQGPSKKKNLSKQQRKVKARRRGAVAGAIRSAFKK